MDMQGLLSDYKQLIDPKQNEKYAGTQEFGRSLLNNLDKHIPSSEDMKDPQAMMDYGFSMNPSSGLVGSIGNPTDLEKAVAEWLRGKGMSNDDIKGNMLIQEAMNKWDPPGTAIKDPTGFMQGTPFQSPDTASHSLRVAKGVSDLIDSFGYHKEKTPGDIRSMLKSVLIQDAGTIGRENATGSGVAHDVLWRSNDFPGTTNHLMTREDAAQTPDGPFHDLMNNLFYKRNQSDIQFEPGTNMTFADRKEMESHVLKTDRDQSIAQSSLKQPDIIKNSRYHHDPWDGKSNAVQKNIDHARGINIPSASRFGGLIDSFDHLAVTDKSGNMPHLDDLINQMIHQQMGPRGQNIRFQPDLFDHFINNGGAEQYLNNVAGKKGDELIKVFKGK